MSITINAGPDVQCIHIKQYLPASSEFDFDTQYWNIMMNFLSIFHQKQT